MKIIRPKKSFTMQPRDTSVLNFLFSNKLATVPQINKAIFKNVRANYAYLRLQKLKGAGYVTSDAVEYQGKNARVYSLSPKGLSYLITYDGLDVHQKQFQSDSRVHDLALVDILYCIKELSCIKRVLTENEIVSCNEFYDTRPYSSFKKLRSDGYCRMNTSSGPLDVAIEYERSLKSEDRITEKMMDYSIESDVDLILCIAGTSNILKKLMQVDRQVYKLHLSKMYFCLLSDVFDGQGKMQFHHQTKDNLLLR